MFVIVAPQVYIEALNKGLIDISFVDFYWHYLDTDTQLLPEMKTDLSLLTWNHLWFLPYLWLYSSLVLLCRFPLRSLSQASWFQKLYGWWAVGLLMALFAAAGIALRADYPPTHTLFGDYYNHAKYFPVFIAGYLLAHHQRWWQQLAQYRFQLLTIAIASYVLLIIERHGGLAMFYQWLQPSGLQPKFYWSLAAVNHWSWILALIALASVYLNKPHPKLKQVNEAILPMYVLHQTVIIMLAWQISTWQLGAVIESVLIIMITILASYGAYFIIRSNLVTRYCFGMKLK